MEVPSMLSRPVLVAVLAGMLTTGIAATVAAGGAPALNLHVIPFDVAGCTAIDPAAMDCDDIDVEGNSQTMQNVYVLVSHVDSLAAVQFGIEYDANVNVLTWVSCTGGQEVPGDGWPASGTGTAITWGTPQYPSSPDSLVLVGYFIVNAASSGTISLIPDPAIGQAIWSTPAPDPEEFPLGQSALGTVDVNGGGQGYSPCGLAGGEPEIPSSGGTGDGEPSGDGSQGSGSDWLGLCHS
jgi:hypothetical protein